MEFTTTIFGGRKLLHNGYIYIKDKDVADVSYWRCEKRGICSSRMITYIGSGSVKKPPSSHNHHADTASVEAAKTIGAIKLRSTQTDDVTSSVIQYSTSAISIPAAVKLPSKEALSKIVRRKRKIAEVDFTESVNTTRGEQFLISKRPEIDLTILGTQENI